MQVSNLKCRLNGKALLLLGSIVSFNPAIAQTTPSANQSETPSEELVEIVVTGTLIKGVVPVGTEITSLTREDIATLGVVSTQDLLSTMPQITSAFNSVQNANTGGNGLTIVRPNIHNIGAAGGNTTLVLFDGHDVVGAGILQTTPDAGILPPIALQGVDVIADGGSAIYGADAVGGIVNFITRKRMEGVEADVHYGHANNYYAYDANIAGGHEWGSGSFMLAYSFRSNSDLTGADRPYYTQNLKPFGGSDNRVATCPLSNVSAGGVNYAMPALAPNTQNLCDADRYTDMFPSERQSSIFGALNQNFSDTISLQLTGYYTDRKTDRLGAQITSTGGITNTNPYFIPVGSAASETVQYSYASAAGYSSRAQTEISEEGVTPEFKFKLGGDWELSALLNFGRSVTTTHTPEINSAADAAALAGTTTATALNPYNVGETDPAVIAQILHYEQFATNTQKLYEGKMVAQGSAFTLPGGDVHLARARPLSKSMPLPVNWLAHRRQTSRSIPHPYLAKY